jgi:hypothetical protein
MFIVGIMTINGLWRFGYYRIFSGRSMENIPIGFNIKIGDRHLLAHIGSGDINNDIVKDDIGDQEHALISMHRLNPMTADITTGNVDTSLSLHELITQLSQERMRIAALESKQSVTESKLSATESMLSKMLQVQSETELKLSVTESRLEQTNALLNDCLNRLAQLEKS